MKMIIIKLTYRSSEIRRSNLSLASQSHVLIPISFAYISLHTLFLKMSSHVYIVSINIVKCIDSLNVENIGFRFLDYRQCKSPTIVQDTRTAYVKFPRFSLSLLSFHFVIEKKKLSIYLSTTPVSRMPDITKCMLGVGFVVASSFIPIIPKDTMKNQSLTSSV